MIDRAIFTLLLITFLILPGCQGTGEVKNLKLHAVPSNTKKQTPGLDSLTILVESFEDARAKKDILGTRTHFWGGVSHFNAWYGAIGEGMAGLAVDYLQQQGWNAVQTNNGPTSMVSQPDVTLSSRVLTFDARAKSRFGATQIDVNLKVGFEATNAEDGSSIRMVLGSTGTDTVMFFDPEDVGNLTNEVVQQLFKQLFKDTKIQGRTLRLKSDDT